MIKHVRTNIGATLPGDPAISMRFADSEEDALAKTVVEMKIPFAVLSPSEIPADQLQPGTYPHTKFQIEAVRYVRDALTAEIERLSNLQDH